MDGFPEFDRKIVDYGALWDCEIEECVVLKKIEKNGIKKYLDLWKSILEFVK